MMGYKKWFGTLPLKMMLLLPSLTQTRRPTLHLLRKAGGVPSQEPRKLDPVVLDNPREG